MEEFFDANSPVRADFERWQNNVGRADPYLSKTTIGIHEVLHAHFLLAEYFFSTGERIGGLGQKILTYYTLLYLGNLLNLAAEQSGPTELKYALA